ncbi:pitrilysin family protein [Nitrosomonas sp.]|uniref:M16 family metallopeptidase n=1 Tax=Nitrosomonas sp. TaxID=42353 RepID=UPI00283F8333|nr:pitrilysin family protein [Nitrosomonas sp.]MDR4513582.1 insulinase family protein [Nitrosomonas sp.]
MKKYIFVLLISIYSQSVFASLAIQFWQTSAGARVYFVENHALPIVDVSIEFAAGSSKDTPEKSGLANLTRRMLKLGAGGLSEDEIANALADVGAQLGSNFDADRAGISLRTLSHSRERKQALDIFSRIIQHPEFPQDILQREKNRIIASIKESSTKPDYIAGLTLMKMLYGDHPYGLNGSGEIDTVAALQLKDLHKFYQSHYVAANAVIAIIGDISKQEAADIAESLTNDLPHKLDSSSIPPVKDPRGQIKRIAHPATQSHIQLAHPGMRRSDPDYFPLLVGNYILGGGGFVSRLMEEIRQQRGLAYSVYSFFAPLREKGPFQIGLQTKKEQSEEALALTQAVLKDFIAKGPSEQELIAAKQNLIGGFPLRLDSNSKILGYLAMIGFYNLPLTYLDDYLKAVEAVTTAQIKDAFSRRIHPEHIVTVIVGAVDE